MLVENMSLKDMISFTPSDEDMAMLPLDVVVYVRCSIISLYKEDNYNAVRFLFQDENFRELFKDIEKTIFYDFDGTSTKNERFVTIGELYGLTNATGTIDTLKEVLEGYNHVADVLLDVFTHDNQVYRISNLDGVVKCESMGR